MTQVNFTRKHGFRLFLFVAFSIIFILTGIPGVLRESKLYGAGYYLSSTFFKSALTFVPFILITIFIALLARRKNVVVLNETGLLDQRFLFKKIFIPWGDLISVEVMNDNKKSYLVAKIKQDKMIYRSVNGFSNGIYKISLKELDFDSKQLDDFLDDI